MNGIQHIRTLHHVRELTPEEEGSSIARLPKGVYGFTYSPGQDEIPVFAHKSYHSFEVHKLEDGSEHIVGYVKPSEAAALETGQQNIEIILYPDAWKDSNQLVTVDLGRAIRARRNPGREEGNPYRLVMAG